jgi:hypothetical protein
MCTAAAGDVMVVQNKVKWGLDPITELFIEEEEKKGAKLRMPH